MSTGLFYLSDESNSVRKSTERINNVRLTYEEADMLIAETIFSIVILSLVVASISWTVTQEEIFAEGRRYCADRSKSSPLLLLRKFFYVFTCEYCLSHWVTLAVLFVSGFRLLYDDWRGFVAAFFVLPWLANQWMSVYRRLRVEIKHENALAESVETKNEAELSAGASVR